ncbi:pre-mRNA splicing factor [Rhizoctonia solani AG-1 IA]|uniref:Pre-mRNA-splicing factor 18 n=1 Tax=Thanatephorus cucumeris (strain AG1-IA) TaxID=983506 RepID=L8WM48_THACA|nr:pre-mRNA splicing factor [Rhizoctonia solani AG-1 IA]
MDFLKAEIAAKRKSGDDASSRPQKYMRKGDIERLKREQKEAEEEAKRKAIQEEQERKEREAVEKAAARNAKSKSNSPFPDTGTPTEGGTSEAFNISNEEAIRRLRQKGQPIRLFAETDRERRLRLRALELIEERGERGTSQNVFKKALEEMEGTLDKEEIERRAGHTDKGKADDPSESSKRGDTPKAAAAEENTIIDLALIKTNPDKLYPLIYYALKRVLKEWEQSMAERPGELPRCGRSTQGKLAAATQVQSAEYLKPLFKQLRSKVGHPLKYFDHILNPVQTVAEDVLGKLAEIIHYMQKREYQKANDAYLRLSIGNAAWPIGVTMVGIHERSAREKISSDQVAHVLNDEVSRKYIQSVKRFVGPSSPCSPFDMLVLGY